MMKCAFILLTLLAFCYSSPVGGGRKISIGEDGSIKILGQYGRWVIISKNSQNHGKNIEIAVGSPSGVFEKIYLDVENNSKSVDAGEERPRNAADIIYGIFQQYQGVVDDQSYNNLLLKVHSYVQSGDLSPSVYNILRGIHGDIKLLGDQVETEYGIQQNGGSSGSRLGGNHHGGVQYGSFLNGLRQNVAWQKDPLYVNKYEVPQLDEPVLYGRVPVDSEYDVQYPAYGNVLSSQRDAEEQLDGYLPVSRELLSLYKPHLNYYQQWANHADYESVQQGYKLYLQLINIQHSQLSSVQQEKLNIIHQQWVNFQKQLSPEELKQLSYLYEQWINCEQVLSAEQYHCDNLHGEWTSFQQSLSLGHRQTLSKIYKQWIAIQQELNFAQLSQLEQLWSNLYQRWVSLGEKLSFEQQYQLSVILPRWIEYNLQRVSGIWSQPQQYQYYNLRYQLVKLYEQLSVEQQQELNYIYQICVMIMRQQINPGEWIQVGYRLKSFVHQLFSGPQEMKSVQNHYFIRFYQEWVNYVENLVNLELTLQNIYERWVMFQQQLNQEQLQQFRAFFPQWISLRVQKFSGIWSELDEQKYEVMQNKWNAFQQQLSSAQKQLLVDLSRACHLISQQNIDSISWSSLLYPLDIFVRQLIVSNQQNIGRKEQLEFYEIFQSWIEYYVSHRLNFEQFRSIYGQSQYHDQLIRSGYFGEVQPVVWGQQYLYSHSRQPNVISPWGNFMFQKAHQNQIVPEQLLQYGVVY
ncbi:unnamed protein product [Phaedon cochleariae]|uniref:Uncharacterized protein n=1 Tax=Phaedon cochleariae TaxID=80249 RepID=A0A9P0DD40_PHACE|nr:unnamed protein product [Phaedon cochleariae]